MQFLRYFFTLGAFILGGFFIFPSESNAVFGDTETFMGKIYSGDGKDGMQAYVDMPQAFTVDKKGNIYIADTSDNVIRKLDANNKITTFSGTGEFGYLDGNRENAFWGSPEGISYGDDGQFYVSDTGNHKIRVVKKNGKASSLPIAGLLFPKGILYHQKKLYIADSGHQRIVRTSAKGGTVEEFVTGMPVPQKMCVRKNTMYFTEWTEGNVWAVDLKSKAKKLMAKGLVEPKAIACDGDFLYFTAGENGVWNEIWRMNLSEKKPKKKLIIQRRETTLLNDVTDIFFRQIKRKAGVDVEEDTDAEKARIEKVKKSYGRKPEKLMYQLHGGGSSVHTTNIEGMDIRQHVGKNRYQDDDGKRGQAGIGHPQALEMTPDGTKMIIVYAQGNKIGEYSFQTNTFNGLAGFHRDSYADAVGLDVRMSDVVTVALSPDGNTLFMADRNNNRIRRLNLKNLKSSYLTGAGEVNVGADAQNGYQEGKPCKTVFETGKSGCAYFNRPTGIVITSNGKTLYVADGSNNRVRAVDVKSGVTSLVAGSGKEGFVDGLGSDASFFGPFTLALGSDEKTLYVTDKNNHAIRAIDLATKRVTTLAGVGRIGYREGTFKNAVFATPEYIERGPDGNLYVSEAGSLRIRKLDLASQTTSLVSGNGNRGAINGLGASSEWNGPKGIAFRGDKMYVADFKNDMIRSIDRN